MARKRKVTKWVILARPVQQLGPGRANRFFARNGTVTQSRDEAAEFATYADAEKFAEEKKIALNDVMRYILEDVRRAGHDENTS
jgi:macrodomain Ter protein organizer (MatP/YcbG family)